MGGEVRLHVVQAADLTVLPELPESGAALGDESRRDTIFSMGEDTRARRGDPLPTRRRNHVWVPACIDLQLSDDLFHPKGDDEFDSEEIKREATATRPLSLKNCDNKTKVE